MTSEKEHILEVEVALLKQRQDSIVQELSLIKENQEAQRRREKVRDDTERAWLIRGIVALGAALTTIVGAMWQVFSKW